MVLETLRRVSADWSCGGSPNNRAAGAAIISRDPHITFSISIPESIRIGTMTAKANEFAGAFSARLGWYGHALCSSTLSPEHDRAQIALTDNQLKTVMRAANGVPVERRGIFLERCAAMLRMRGRLSDADVQDVTALALAGLVQQAADVAS